MPYYLTNVTPAKATIEMLPQKEIGWHEGHCFYWNVKSSHNGIISYSSLVKIKLNPMKQSNLTWALGYNNRYITSPITLRLSNATYNNN